MNRNPAFFVHHGSKTIGTTLNVCNPRYEAAPSMPFPCQSEPEKKAISAAELLRRAISWGITDEAEAKFR